MSEAQSETTVVQIAHPLHASRALAHRATYEADIRRWEEMINSGALPKHVRTPQMAITLARAGELYRWDPIRSLRSLFLVEGRIEMWAQDMAALIRERCPDATMQPIEVGPTKVVIRVFRPPQMTDPFDVITTIEQFQHLTNKGSSWKHYPEDMLWARAVSRVARRFFSDITAGAYAVGEIEENATVTVRQVGPKEVPMPTADEASDAEIVNETLQEIDRSDYCDLCHGEEGQHADEMCPNRSVADVYGEQLGEEGGDAA